MIDMAVLGDDLWCGLLRQERTCTEMPACTCASIFVFVFIYSFFQGKTNRSLSKPHCKKKVMQSTINSPCVGICKVCCLWYRSV